jgi:carbonic anhydrase
MRPTYVPVPLGAIMRSIDFIYRFDPSNPNIKPPPADANAARRMLEEGNLLFSRWVDTCRRDDSSSQENAFIAHYHPQDLGMPTATGEAAAQAPFAVLLGCSDARVPAEIIFGQARNNLFVVRLAGNILTDGAMGSIEYALQHLSTSVRLVVVLGHTRCGAVSAAVDTYLDPWSYLANTTHSIRSIVNRILVPVRKAAKALESIWGAEAAQIPGYREALIETAVFVNTAQTAFNLHEETEQGDYGDIQVVYGVFDLVTHRVWTLPSDPKATIAGHISLAVAPTTLAEFEELALRAALRMTRKVQQKG